MENRELFSKFDISELDDHLLNRRQEQDADNLLSYMKKLNTITLKLQNDDVLISQVRKCLILLLNMFRSSMIA